MQEEKQNTETKKPSNPRIQNFDGVYASDAYKSEDYVSLRDEIAMRAMQGLISNSDWMKTYGQGEKYLMSSDITAEVAYGYADAMLKQREIENL